MLIQINNKPLECSEGATLQEVVALLDLPERGVAVAVNNQMISRSEWERTRLSENDSLVVIKAACGG